MRKLTKLAFCISLLALLALALSSRPALAGEVDCGGSCTFFSGTLQSDQIVNASVGGSDWKGLFNENIYLDGAGVYTYVFDLLLTSGTDLGIANSTGVGTPLGNFFDTVGLNFGVIGLSVSGNPFTGTSSGVTASPFLSSSSTLQTGSNVAGTKEFEFYAQSKGAPGAGKFNFLDGGNSNTDSWDPVPEPGTIALLGTGLLLFGLLLRRKLPSLPQLP